MKKLILMLASIVIFSSVSSARELKIVSHPFPPWQFQNQGSPVQGINIDVLNLVAKNIGISIEFVNHPWARAWKTIKGGDGDALISVSRKAPREPFIWYPSKGTDLWISRYVFFTHAQTKKAFQGTYQDIIDNKMTVCIVNGYSYNKSFWKAFPYKKAKFTDKAGKVSVDRSKYVPDRRDYHPLIKNTTKPEFCFNQLTAKRVNVLISDESIGLYTVKTMVDSGKGKIKSGDIVSYSATLVGKGYPIAFAKNSNYPDLENVGKRFWKELLRIQDSGEYQKIVDRWLN